MKLSDITPEQRTELTLLALYLHSWEGGKAAVHTDSLSDFTKFETAYSGNTLIS